MKVTSVYSLLFVIVAMLMGCQGGKFKINALNNAAGQPYEVIVVMDPDAYQAEAGRALYDILNDDVPALPQSEPLMRISSVAPEYFDNYLRAIRNILIVDISEKYTSSHITYKKDQWVNGQLVIYLRAPSQQALLRFLQAPENGEKIVRSFYNSELNRAATYFVEYYNREMSNMVIDQFGVSLNIPDFFTATKVGENFLWATDNAETPMSIMIYSMPYRDADAFTREKLIQVRDSVLKVNLPGALPNSFMRTNKIMTPLYREISVSNQYCAELRGLWEMENDMMGGPFVSHTRLDAANNKVITVEAFVFAPSKSKRNMIRRLEAVLYTLRLPGDVTLPEVSIGIEEQENN